MGTGPVTLINVFEIQPEKLESFLAGWRERAALMSSPVSSRGLLIAFRHAWRAQVFGGVVGAVGLPAVPDHVEPCAGEDARGVGVISGGAMARSYQ